MIWKREPKDYQEVLDPGRRRRALLYRAALAIGVMLVLVVGLMIHDEPEPAVPPLAPPGFDFPAAPEPSPVPSFLERTPPEVGVRPGGDAVTHGEDDAESVAGGAEVVDEREPVVEVVEQPVARVEQRDDTAETGRPAADAPAGVATPEATAGRPVSSAPAPASAPPPGASIPAVANGHRVQLEQFVEAGRADALLAELRASGYPVSALHRVAVGPFAQRAQATSAMERLNNTQQMRGIIVPDVSGSGFSVQLGVFGDAGNAGALRDRLRAAGFAAELHRRVVLGPYRERAQAETVLAEMRAAGRQGFVIAAP